MEKITLTPAEKAKELEGKYFDTILLSGGNLVNETIIKNLSKLCATMAVDEILDLHYPAETLEELDDHLTYWDLVIEEIEKL